MAVNSAARVWGPYKELLSTVELAVHHRQPDAIQDLEVALRKHKPDFISFLKNPAKNAHHRQAVQKANKEGLPVQGQQSTQLLSTAFIEEALIISDLFDLNEYAAVELLLDGENQQSQFPGLSRGLVAVLLYYDGRVALVSALKALLQSRPGLTWAPCADVDLQKMLTKYTDELISSGLISKILTALHQLSDTKEIVRLEQHQALGSARHRQHVTVKLAELRGQLAECVLCAACQARLGAADSLHVLHALRQHASLDADATLDDAALTLTMAAAYCFNVRYLDHNDETDAMERLPVLSESNYVSQIHRELVISNHTWAVDGVRSVLQFVWAIMLRHLSQYNALNAGLNEYCEQDEQVIEMAIERDVFPFLRSAILSKDSFHKEQFYVCEVHRVLSEFLVSMPLKVKELRNRGDETARIIVANEQEGLVPPTGPRRDFEHLMLLMSELYSRSPHGATFAADFWCADLVRSPTGGMYRAASAPDIQISLNKFVRLAGDLLPPPLYIPYIKMLAGLANGPTGAHHTYNLLKANGQTSGGSVSTVSWDHFFQSLSQYYSVLRSEAPLPVSDLAHVYRGAGGQGAGHAGGGVTGARAAISAQEVNGLLAWLELTRTVAYHDEGARVALVENQAWLPLVVLLGMVACPIPPKLKAALLNTLAAFAKTPDIATSLWHAIEHAQIIPTVNMTTPGSQHSPGGLMVELEEVEARQEEFPMTVAFLNLVRALIESPIPAGLGAGYRAPGFQPYLTFLRDNVFLKFNTRAYKDPAEKWEVGAGVLEILHKLLACHEVYREDLVDENGSGGQAGKPPGHTLLLHMLNDSAMLKMILYIIDEATKQLDRYVEFPGKACLERCGLLCLRLVECALELQDAFLAAVRDTGAAVMATSMDKLLLAINPRSGRPDHLVNIAKFVTWGATLKCHALSAVRILHTVSQCPPVQPKLVGLLSAAPDKNLLLHGFVECLEAEGDEEEDDDDGEEEEKLHIDVNPSTVRNLTRQTILRLLLATLDQPAPNLAHFLLGFNLSKPVTHTNLQDPGVLGSARTCLHSVLCLLNTAISQHRALAASSGSGSTGESAGSVEACQLGYHLVYRLCANPDTSGPTMRYLRSTHDFLQRHLAHVPFTPPTGASPSVVTSLLNQQSWLLKTLAIELRVTSSNRQRSHTQRLMALMLDDNPAALSQKVLGPDGVYDADYSQYDSELSLFNTTSQMQYNQALTGGSCRRRLLAVLSCLELHQPAPSALQLEYLSPGAVQAAVDARQTLNEHGVQLCDVKSLYAAMIQQLNANPAGNTGHRKLMMQEIGAICENVLERNAYGEGVHSKRHALEAWRQVVEIILTACPADLLAGEHRHNVLLELLQDLLMKVTRQDTLPELSSSISGVILTLMANLRQCFLGGEDEEGAGGGGEFSSMHRSEGFAQLTGARTMYASSLQVVLKGLIDFLISSSSRAQRVRANLYGALLYFLQIGQKPKNISETDQWGGGGGGVGGRLTGKESEYDKLMAQNVEALSGYGDNLMDVLCRDACDGHHVCRMLSLACLDSILSIEHGRTPWLNYLSSRGYLQHLIESLTHDDQELQAMLQPQPHPLKALYIFESKIGLLTRVGECSSGAHLLLQCGVMARLAECAVFDLRPEADHQAQGFIPTVLKRYRYQILFPVLKLCLAMLTSLGLENVEGSQHVLRFVVGHVDVFHAILHGEGGRWDTAAARQLDARQELALVTAVLSRAATLEVEGESMLGDGAAIETRSQLSRLQRQMIALLPKYCLSDSLLKQLKSLETGPEGGDIKIRIQLAVEEVACNVMAFCRGIVAKSGSSANDSCFRLLFGPSLDVPQGCVGSGEEPVVAPATAASRPQSLGLLVHVLRQATVLFLTAFDEHKQIQRKIHTVADLGVEEIKELCEGSSSMSSGEKMSAQHRQQIAKCRLAQRLYYKQRNLQLFSYIVENSLYLLWRHLDFYLVHCLTMDPGSSILRMVRRQQMRRLQDSAVLDAGGEYDDDGEAAMWRGVSRDQVQVLKQTVCHVINDSLLTRLTDIEQCYSRDRTRYGFMEALIRRMKRLLKLHTV